MTRATRGRLVSIAVWLVFCAALTTAEVEYSCGFMNPFDLLLGLAFMLSVLGVLIGAGIWAWRRSTQWLRRSSAILACLVASGWTAGVIDRVQARRSRAVGAQVVDAVEHFHSTEGHYPDSLGDLTPKYLSEVPHTSMGIWGRPFRYHQRNKLSYSLSFERSVGLYSVYESSDGRWYDRD